MTKPEVASLRICGSLFWAVSVWAATLAWGLPSNGLAIAIHTSLPLGVNPSRRPNTLDPEARIEVAFRNTTAATISFVAGGESGAGSTYDIHFISTGPDGHTCKLLDVKAGVVGGYLAPIVMHLKRGETKSVVLDPRYLICTAKKNVPIDKLLRQGHSVRATFTSTPESNKWGRLRSGWTGSIASGPFTIRSAF